MAEDRPCPQGSDLFILVHCINQSLDNFRERPSAARPGSGGKPTQPTL